MGQEPNWDLINKCGVWKVLGVTECDGCPSCIRCWGSNSKLPEPRKNEHPVTIMCIEGLPHHDKPSRLSSLGGKG